jgi:regulator of sirC expression with transglutaminase-like and TPR domain
MPGCSGRSDRRQILARILRNLRAAHLARRDWPAAVDAIDLLLVLEPTDPEHGRDRGLLLGRMGGSRRRSPRSADTSTSGRTPTTSRTSGR